MLSLFLIVPKTLVAQIPHWVYHKHLLLSLVIGQSGEVEGPTAFILLRTSGMLAPCLKPVPWVASASPGKKTLFLPTHVAQPQG